MERILVPPILTGFTIFMFINLIWDYFQCMNGRNSMVDRNLFALRTGIEKSEEHSNMSGIYKSKKVNIVIFSVFTAAILFIYGLTSCFGRTIYFSMLLLFIVLCTFESINEKKRNSFSLQFKDWLYSISNSIKAGMSLEEAIRYSEKDIKNLYGGFKNNTIVKCVQDTIMYLNYGKPVTQALEAFNINPDNSDANTFITAVKIIRDRGGNIAEVIDSISDTISEKIVLSGEIKLMLYAKRIEGKIIILVPLLLLGLIFIISPEYITVMFSTTAGICIYTASFLLIAAGYIASSKITKIDIK